MPTIYDLKPLFQRLLRPCTTFLARCGVTANQVTVAALVLSAAAGALLAVRPEQTALPGMVPLVLLFRMALNAIDGLLAREHGMKSRLGALLNELGDVLADAALYLPLALVHGIDAPLMVLFVLLGIVVEMTGVIAIQVGAARNYAGPMGKSDRAVLVGVLGLVLALGIPAGLWSTLLLICGIVLSGITVINRARSALRETA